MRTRSSSSFSCSLSERSVRGTSLNIFLRCALARSREGFNGDFELTSPFTSRQVQSLPRYTSQAVSQAIKVLSAPYAEYASAFRTLDRSKVAAAVEKGRDVFARVSLALPSAHSSTPG